MSGKVNSSRSDVSNSSLGGLYPDLSGYGEPEPDPDLKNSFSTPQKSRNDSVDDSDDPDFKPAGQKVEEESSESSVNDSREEIPLNEVEKLLEDQERPPINQIHGRGSVHLNESPAWKSSHAPTRRRQRDAIADRSKDSHVTYSKQSSHQHWQIGNNESICEKLESSRISSNAPPICIDKANLLTPNVIDFLGKSIIVLLLVIAILYYIMSSGAPVVQEAGRPNFIELKYRVEILREKYQTENQPVWRRLLASTLPLFDRSPLKPGVAVIAYSGSDQTANCAASSFAGELTQLLQRYRTDVERPLYIPESLLSSDRKLELDETLRGGFDKGVMVAILPHLERFDREALLLMHAYCDDQYAPYRDVLFIFLAEVGPGTKASVDVQNFLMERFATRVGEDEAGALVSRLVRNAAKLEPESLPRIGCRG